jgi:hypothetical protein
MAIAGFTATIVAAAYLISSRRTPEPAPDDVAATESPAGDTGSTWPN